jgi:hypothetical protein
MNSGGGVVAALPSAGYLQAGHAVGKPSLGFAFACFWSGATISFFGLEALVTEW